MTPMRRTPRHWAAALVAIAIALAACETVPPPPGPTAGAVQPTPVASETDSATPSGEPTSQPSSTPVPATGPFPLAVVTGLTNLKASTTIGEIADLAAAGALQMPCGVTITAPGRLVGGPGPDCLPADAIADAIRTDQTLVALLPPGLVEPATKVLPIGGDGPFGLGGADLFGSAESRGQDYPIIGEPSGSAPLEADWVAYDGNDVWTLVSLGGSCLDRNVAYAALELGYGWDWVMDGGTASYRGIHLNPNPPPGVSQELVVDAVPTGNRGAVPRLVSGADVTLDDFDCTVTKDWQPNYGRALFFSTSAEVLPLLRNKLGIDVMKVAGNHSTDRGAAGVRETLRHLDAVGILGVGVGRNLDEALEPVYLEVAGLKVAFVSWNAVAGSVEADADTTGVAWLRKANVFESVGRARASGADLVICAPEWWGGAEYHLDIRPSQERQLRWFDQAGCDEVLGHGTHLAGPVVLRRPGDDGAQAVVVSEGNFLFGQGWWQQVQEGIIVELSFSGTKLVNLRLHPYIMLEAAQASLTDPEGDGRHVLRRVWRNSDIETSAGG
jgi:poly-gamma-glutamate capsule biosynthesis protein CapA/YwtB (metallophosphatase superfamily)